MKSTKKELEAYVQENAYELLHAMDRMDITGFRSALAKAGFPRTSNFNKITVQLYPGFEAGFMPQKDEGSQEGKEDADTANDRSGCAVTDSNKKTEVTVADMLEFDKYLEEARLINQEAKQVSKEIKDNLTQFTIQTASYLEANTSDIVKLFEKYQSVEKKSLMINIAFIVSLVIIMLLFLVFA